MNVIYDDVNYIITGNDGSNFLVSVGDNRQYQSSSITIPASFTTSSGAYLVTGIINSAFAENSIIQTVDLSSLANNNLESIGDDTFKFC